jgi:hypothetical protein
MNDKNTISNEEKVIEIKVLCEQALKDIDKIKKNRDEKIKELMQKIDKKSADKILKDIKNLE